METRDNEFRRRVDGKGIIIALLLLLVTAKVFSQITYTPYAITTIAGSPQVSGSKDGTNSGALFKKPEGIAVDPSGNLYVVDTYNQVIRNVAPVGSNWVVTTIAGQVPVHGGTGGNADGTNGEAQFKFPFGLAIDAATNIYVADGGNSEVRLMSPRGTNWVVTTIAIGTNAQFSAGAPSGIAVDNATNIYVVDSFYSTIRKIALAGTNGTISTIAGSAGNSGSADGTNGDARFYDPSAIVVDAATNLYVTDFGNGSIRKITPAGSNWIVTTIAGIGAAGQDVDGTNQTARFSYPYGLAIDAATNLYVGGNAATIRRIKPVGTNWVTTTLAGLDNNAGTNDGTGNVARFCNQGSELQGLACDQQGNVYITDAGNFTIRKGNPESVPAIIGANPGFANGQFNFSLTAPAGQMVVLEASADLQSWQPVWTNMFPSNGVLLYKDAQSAALLNRYYRALTP